MLMFLPARFNLHPGEMTFIYVWHILRSVFNILKYSKKTVTIQRVFVL